MVKVKIICVGDLKEQYFKSACAEYAKRLGAFCGFEIIELNEARLPDDPSQAQIEKALETESKAIMAKIPKSARVYALCIEGKHLDSESFAAKIESDMQYASEIVFVIGSSFGLHPSVKQRADFKLSMSEMTFPHRLARVMLCEQIYRAFQIMNGGKYHK